MVPESLARELPPDLLLAVLLELEPPLVVARRDRELLLLNEVAVLNTESAHNVPK